jgi:hypothetical protein
MNLKQKLESEEWHWLQSAAGEKLSGNVVKESLYRGTAVGLRIAIALFIEDQKELEPVGLIGPVEPPAFICPDCGAKSFNPKDLIYGYCGRCKMFTRDGLK